MGLAPKPTVSCVATNHAAGWLVIVLGVLPIATSAFRLLDEIPSAALLTQVDCPAHPGAAAASEVRSLLQFSDAVRSHRGIVSVEGESSISSPKKLGYDRLGPQTGNTSFSKDDLSAVKPLGLADAVVLSHLVTLHTPVSLAEAQRQQLVTDEMTDALVHSFFQRIFFNVSETVALFMVPGVLLLLLLGAGVVVCLTCGVDTGAGSPRWST
mmetsp:Transcript_66850/g.160013  ORF Transcript_66850/g.160013 Transcript_66850/m.160013 type:complete len:211 (-) Transcript_66850:78-710(-)|eukprot:CAMPEP_0178421912 /NCGR_PEP_ID=MMETSP0689_2-20121128/26896_1 /TAXON_ID=160604 /ORGANISM="Amphidinium massartii, Strain CS-259" /LENGTH=210 /DNA_ID=CAMNT_0020043447 /DNA_START=161 /DNA_END=793 /DNA_ORIENTATION=+